MGRTTLASPVNIGKLQLKNRLAMAPTLLSIAGDNGEITQDIIEYYEARAKGGVGLIITGAAHVMETGKIYPRTHAISNDGHVSGWSKLVQSIQSYNTKIAIQLSHGGARSRSVLTGEQPVAPSSLTFPDIAETPRELSTEEIHGLVLAFGEAARRTKESGFDAIELHCSAGFLIHQFISPYSNRRQDEYGGNFAKRMRFPLEIVGKMKEKVGGDFPIGCRIPHDEIVSGGLTLEDTGDVTVELARAGIDFVRVVVGVSPPKGRADSQRTSTARPEGQLPELSRAMKQMVEVTVIATGGINTTGQAEQLLHSGSADLVAVGSALLSDPCWLEHSPGYVEMFPGVVYCPKCRRKL